MEREIPKKKEVYRHFKGNFYRVICVAKDAEDEREKAIYYEIGNSHKIWSRDLEEFMSKIDYEKYPKVQEIYRFNKTNFIEYIFNMFINKG